MSLEVLENPSMFAGVAANENGLIALEYRSDALQAFCAAERESGVCKGARWNVHPLLKNHSCQRLCEKAEKAR